MDTTAKHECPEIKKTFNTEFRWSLENRGDGWYMYNEKGERSKSQYNFCPSCGAKLQ